MDRRSRREVALQYKESRPAAGVFAVRCAATGEVWVGASRNLDQQQNGLWFQLKLGSFPNPALQHAWREHGAAAFLFERLEALDAEDLSPTAIGAKLKASEARWRERLGAAEAAG
jgi:hypothetical protein